MSSLQENYGNLHVKEIEFANKLVSHGSADNTNELTIEFANQSADRTLTVPALGANANIITSESDINATKLDFTNLTASVLANADEVIVKSGGSVKKTTISALKTAIDSQLDIGSLTAMTTAEVVKASDSVAVDDDSAGVSKKLSIANLNAVAYGGVFNHATVGSTGSLAMTTAGKQACLALASGHITSSFGNVTITNAGKGSVLSSMNGHATADATGAVTISASGKNASLDAMSGHATASSGSVTISATGKGAVLSLMSADATCSTAGAVALADKPSAKKACEANKFLHADANRDISNINELQATEVQVGADEWKMVVNSSSKNLELKYWNSTASAWQTKFTFNHNV